MFPLTYETLITRKPFYFASILAGWSGKRNDCLSVSLGELPKQNNSLLLVRYSEENLLFLERAFKDPNTSGIIIFANQSEYVGSTLTNLADLLEKPLLFLENHEGDILFEKVSQILELYKNNLHDIFPEDLSTYWLHLFYQKDISHVMERLNTMMGQEVYFYTNKYEFSAIGSSTSPPVKSIDEFGDIIKDQITLVQKNGVEYYLYQILDLTGTLIGYFILEKIYDLTTNQLNLLNSITTTILTWFTQLELTRNVHAKYKDQFIFDLLNNNIETESQLIELGKLWDMEFHTNGYVLAINLNSIQAITKELSVNISHLLKKTNNLNITIHTTFISHRLVGIIFLNSKSISISKDDLNQWLKAFQKQVSEKFSAVQTIVGIGRSHSSNLDIYKSFQEAKIALQMRDYVYGNKGIIHYEDIGYVRLLTYIHNDLLNDFANQYIGDLAKHDREHDTELVHTLYMFCNFNGDINRSADSLFIHQNTLRQRLKKIESILEVDLQNYTELVNVILSLKIAQNLNQ
ncbi:MAG: PucR family transcriptional regulator [Anaerobacillus sp.]|uniref:PucR family transcriptional regulator n=1 Tax=Anaerobacillus sp. TaxID=1872506 RepID=UPI00391C3443